MIIDPVAGSGTTLRAAAEIGRSCYGFEIDKKFYKAANEKMLANIQLMICETPKDNKREKYNAMKDQIDICELI